MTIRNKRRPHGKATFVKPIDRAIDLIAQSQVKPPIESEPSHNTVQRVNVISGDFAITPDGTLLSQYNPKRASLIVQNKSSLTVFINEGAAAHVGDIGVGTKIDAGGFYEPNAVPVNAIYAWTPVGNALISFKEGTQ